MKDFALGFGRGIGGSIGALVLFVAGAICGMGYACVCIENTNSKSKEQED